MTRQLNKTVYLLLACSCALLCTLGATAVADEVNYTITTTPNGPNGGTGGTWAVYAQLASTEGNTIYGLSDISVNVTASGGAVINYASISDTAPVAFTGGKLYGFYNQPGVLQMGNTMQIVEYQTPGSASTILGVGLYPSATSPYPTYTTTFANPVEVATGTYTFTGPGSLSVTDANYGMSDPSATLLLVGTPSGWNGGNGVAAEMQSPTEQSVVAVPEPSTLAALVTGAACGLGLLGLRRRARRPAAQAAAQA